MSDFINISVTGQEQIAQELDGLYPAMANRGVETASTFLAQKLNDYEHAAPYNYVSWESVGGFVSDKQRRFVMAGIADGSIVIPYPRTSRDHYRVEGSGTAMRVMSDDVSMYYSMSDQGQARMQMLRGWDKISVFLLGLEADIVNAFRQGVEEAIQIMSKLGMS